MIQTVVAILTSSLLLFSPGIESPVVSPSAQLVSVQPEAVLASEILALSQRNPSKAINDGFKENILVNLDYINRLGEVVLQPGEVFAFHKNILPEFRQEKIITQESEYRPVEGYKLVAGLWGNGVCHLATLMNWVASESGLAVTSPVSHDFAPVPGVERQYGTSIKFYPNVGGSSERQNLYIKNNKDYPVKFRFTLEGEVLRFEVLKTEQP